MQLECSATLIYRANSRAVTMLKSSEPGKIVTDLFQAYFDTRKNKRSTLNALAFEKHFESNIFELADEIMENRYVIKPSMCFVEELTFQLYWLSSRSSGQNRNSLLTMTICWSHLSLISWIRATRCVGKLKIKTEDRWGLYRNRNSIYQTAWPRRQAAGTCR